LYSSLKIERGALYILFYPGPCYFFGAPCLSCAYNVKTQSGDQFEIDVPGFGRPLRNTMSAQPEQHFAIRTL